MCSRQSHSSGRLPLLRLQKIRSSKKLREAGVIYKVYKNTYLNFAFKEPSLNRWQRDLNGPTAVAFGLDDVTAPQES